jgi:AcrR family transcriptional regulator/predicted GNAT family N-acyltransferase
MGESRTSAPLRLGLERRTHPAQARARKTVDHILETAAVLLDEVGVDAFNTNLLAERAGVGIRTVYRYYPNKLVILAALMERIGGEWARAYGGFERMADPVWDWRAALRSLADGFIRGAERNPGWIAIMSALRALPELRQIAREQADLAANQLAESLRGRDARGSDAELRICAQLVMEAGGQLVDGAVACDGTVPEDLVRELTRMQHAYLAPLLDRPGVRAGRVELDQLAPCCDVRRRVFVEEQGLFEAEEFDAEDARCVHFIARRGGEPVGAARLRVNGHAPSAEQVAVLAEHRRGGVGRELMRALQAEAASRGFEELMLNAQESAVAFFERLGYRCEGEPFEEAGISHRMMRKRLRGERPGE